MGAAGKGERVAAAIAAVAVSLSLLAGLNRLADGYAREAFEAPRLDAGGMRLAPGKIIACLRSLA